MHKVNLGWHYKISFDQAEKSRALGGIQVAEYDVFRLSTALRFCGNRLLSIQRCSMVWFWSNLPRMTYEHISARFDSCDKAIAEFVEVCRMGLIPHQPNSQNLMCSNDRTIDTNIPS